MSNIFVTAGDFLRESILGGETVGYILFGIFLVAMLFIFMLSIDIPARMAFALMLPAIIGVFSIYVKIIWLVVIMLIFTFITLGILALNQWGGNRN